MPFVKPPLGSLFNHAHPLAEELRLAYLFQQRGGYTVPDAVGESRRVGTLTNFADPPTSTSGFVASPYGPALAFDGSNDRILLSTTPFIAIDFSAFFLVRQTGDCALLGNTAAGNPQLRIGQSGSNVLSCFDGTNNPQSSTLSTAQGNWTLVGFTRSGSTVTFWEGSQARGTGTMTGTQTFNQVGMFLTTAQPFNGTMAGLWAWNRSLSAQEVRLFTVDPFAPWRRRSLATYFVPVSVGSVSLTANSLLFGTPSLATPTISQTHALTGNNLSSAAPTLATPAISQVHAIAAANLTSGTPTLATPTLTQTHALTADGLTSANPILSSPILSQSHSLAATNLTSGTPTLGNPSTSGNISLTANDLTSASPVFDTPTVTQAFALTANTLTSGTPSLGTPTISQTHTLTAIELLCGSPTLGTPAVTQVHSLTANALTSGTPVLGNPAFVNPFIPTRIALTWEVPRGTIRSWEARRPMRFAWEYP